MTKAFSTENWKEIVINSLKLFYKLSDDEKLLLWNTLKPNDINFNPDLTELTLRLSRKVGCSSITQFCDQFNFTVDQVRTMDPVQSSTNHQTGIGDVVPVPIPVMLPMGPSPGVTNTQAEFAASSGPQAPIKDDTCGDILCWWCLWNHWSSPGPIMPGGSGATGSPCCCCCCCDDSPATGNDDCCDCGDGCCDCGDCACGDGADCGDCGVDF